MSKNACPQSPVNEVSIEFGRLEEGLVISRPNRFLAVVQLGKHVIQAHVPDPGRLEELLFPSNKVMVRDIRSQENMQRRSNRKTDYDLVLASSQGVWVCVDTRYPNALFKQAAQKGALSAFHGYTDIKSEVGLNKVMEGSSLKPIPDQGKRKTPVSRFDFMLQGPGKKPAVVEVKSVSLCANCVGLFPDAPTERGARHLRELKHLFSDKLDTYVVFIAQREDITTVSANIKTDPGIAKALNEAIQAGVQVLAYRCTVTPQQTILDPNPIPYK